MLGRLLHDKARLRRDADLVSNKITKRPRRLHPRKHSSAQKHPIRLIYRLPHFSIVVIYAILLARQLSRMRMAVLTTLYFVRVVSFADGKLAVAYPGHEYLVLDDDHECG